VTRILVLSNLYPPHDYGGYEQSCADVMERLAARGHQVLVLTSDHRRPDRLDPGPAGDSLRGLGGAAGPGGADAGAGAFPVERTLRIYWDDQRLLVPPRRTRLAWERHNHRRLAAAFDRFGPEVVSVWNMGAMSFGLLEQLRHRAAPVVYAVCNDWTVWGPDQDAWMKGWADRPGQRRLARRLTGLPTEVGDLGASGTFLFVSDWTRRYAQEHSRWSYPDSTVVYSGVEASEFGAGAGAGAGTGTGAAAGNGNGNVGRRPWRWRLLFVGRLDPDKGAPTAVEALAQLPGPATLDVVGPGSASQRRELDSMVDRLGLSGRVRFSALPRAQLARRYQEADVLLFPSRWEEPFGLTPLEAMACGTPVVGTCLGGAAEYLRPGQNCLVVPREDPVALAAAVQQLAARPDLRERLAAGGSITASQLTTDQLADSFEQWLEWAARGRAGPRPAERILAAAG
jgi:glycogen(starch) synthase